MMGLTPRDVDTLTLPEMAAMFQGFRAFHSGQAESDEAPAEPDMDEFFRARAENLPGGAA